MGQDIRPRSLGGAYGSAFLGVMASLALSSGASAGPAAFSSQPRTLVSAATQPLRDIGILRPKIDGELQRARSDPYGMENLSTCEALQEEIAALDVALGPDVDVAGAGKGRSLVTDVMADAVGGLVKLPLRGAVRYVSGAQRRDWDLEAAVRAGVARRAFLKGVGAGQCGSTRLTLQDHPATAPGPGPEAPGVARILVAEKGSGGNAGVEKTLKLSVLAPED